MSRSMSKTTPQNYPADVLHCCPSGPPAVLHLADTTPDLCQQQEFHSGLPPPPITLFQISIDGLISRGEFRHLHSRTYASQRNEFSKFSHREIDSQGWEISKCSHVAQKILNTHKTWSMPISNIQLSFSAQKSIVRHLNWITLRIPHIQELQTSTPRSLQTVTWRDATGTRKYLSTVFPKFLRKLILMKRLLGELHDEQICLRWILCSLPRNNKTFFKQRIMRIFLILPTPGPPVYI